MQTYTTTNTTNPKELEALSTRKNEESKISYTLMAECRNIQYSWLKWNNRFLDILKGPQSKNASWPEDRGTVQIFLSAGFVQSINICVTGVLFSWEIQLFVAVTMVHCLPQSKAEKYWIMTKTLLPHPLVLFTISHRLPHTKRQRSQLCFCHCQTSVSNKVHHNSIGKLQWVYFPFHFYH